MQSAISYFTNEEWESSCEKIVKSLACSDFEQISGREDSFVWGICAFGDQKTPPPLSFPEIKSCSLSLMMGSTL
ncbi:hypothetical protein ACE6H2_019833 [Prunus campanulata]